MYTLYYYIHLVYMYSTLYNVQKAWRKLIFQAIVFYLILILTKQKKNHPKPLISHLFLFWRHFLNNFKVI